MKRYVVIVAGGSGSRMNAEIPKQFMLLGGKPVIMHTMERFQETDSTIEIILVLPEKEIGTWKELCNKYSFHTPHRLATGGETRFQSVRNGLQFVNETSVVAVHDGVRPFVSPSLIKQCFEEAEKRGNAVPAVSVNESLRKVEGGQNTIAHRSAFVMIQTPQCFDSNILNEAYRAEYKAGFTDDAGVVESMGVPIHLVKGERENIKITYPMDLLVGEALLKKLQSKK